MTGGREIRFGGCEDGDLLGWISRIVEIEHGHGDLKQRCSV